MIHAIYIYFIINAFIAGGETDKRSFWIMFLFGLPYHLIDISWYCIKQIYSNSGIKTLYKLYFTNFFANLNLSDVARLKIYYQANIDNNRKYKNWLLKQIDKKYNYGITKS